MADKTYVVTAASALVYTVDGPAATLDRGAAVPANADPERVKLLLDRGIIAEGEPEGGVASDPDAAPPFKAPADDEDKPASRRGAAKSTGDGDSEQS